MFDSCDPMNCSTPGFPVLHNLPEFAQTHVHWVGDAIQPTHPLLSHSPSSPSPWNDITYIQIPDLWLNTHCPWRIYLTSLWQRWLVAHIKSVLPLQYCWVMTQRKLFYLELHCPIPFTSRWMIWLVLADGMSMDVLVTIRLVFYGSGWNFFSPFLLLFDWSKELSKPRGWKTHRIETAWLPKLAQWKNLSL